MKQRVAGNLRKRFADIDRKSDSGDLLFEVINPQFMTSGHVYVRIAGDKVIDFHETLECWNIIGILKTNVLGG